MFGKELLRIVKGSVLQPMLEVLLMKQMSKGCNLNCDKLGSYWEALEREKQGKAYGNS